MLLLMHGATTFVIAAAEPRALPLYSALAPADAAAVGGGPTGAGAPRILVWPGNPPARASMHVAI